MKSAALHLLVFRSPAEWPMLNLVKRLAPRITGIFFLLASVMFDCPSSYASSYYSHTIIAKTGQAGLTGMGDMPSINDNGRVAFVGQVSGHEGIFVGDGINLGNITPDFSNETGRFFGRAVQINNNNQVVGYDRRNGS